MRIPIPWTVFTVVAILLGGIPLQAQQKPPRNPETIPSASVDSILRAVSIGDEMPRREIIAFLTQYSGARENPEHFGPRSRAELDAFADRLVAIAIANPRSKTAASIARSLRAAGTPIGWRVPSSLIRSHMTPYDGYFDALMRLYEGDVILLVSLVAANPRLGLDLVMRKLEANDWKEDEICGALSTALRYGDVNLVSGQPEFTPYPGARLSAGGAPPDRDDVPSTRRPNLPWTWKPNLLSQELVAMGYLEKGDICIPDHHGWFAPDSVWHLLTHVANGGPRKKGGTRD